METPYIYLLIVVGLLSGYVVGLILTNKKKVKAEKRVSELEMNMLDDKLEISRLKTLIGKLLEMRNQTTTVTERFWHKENA